MFPLQNLSHRLSTTNELILPTVGDGFCSLEKLDTYFPLDMPFLFLGSYARHEQPYLIHLHYSPTPETRLFPKSNSPYHQAY